jgi:hypothetical protein
MSHDTPFYKRTLDSFADDVITRQRPRADGGWHAVLDTGVTRQVSDPDFSPSGYGATREEAARRCARAIRDDASGIGKFAPHSVLEDGYDLRWRLMRHWDKKERMAAVGLDPNEVMADACGMDVDRWKLKGAYLEWSRDTRRLEFDFRLLLAEAVHAVAEGGADPGETREALAAAVRAAYAEGSWRTSAGEDTWALMDERIESAFDMPGAGPSAPGM